jgi:hypothetical protein
VKGTDLYAEIEKYLQDKFAAEYVTFLSGVGVKIPDVNSES